MLHSTSLLPHNNRFLFSFGSQPSYSHSHSHSLSFSKFLSLPSSLSSCCRVARISTETLEVSQPPPNDFNFHREIARLAALRHRLAACATLGDKLRVLNADSRVKRFFGSRRGLSSVLASFRLSSDQLFLLKCVVAAGQEHVLYLDENEALESAAAAASAVKSALYVIAEMIENLDSYSGNGGTGLGMALEDHEIMELKKLLETLAEIERFYDCIGGIIGSVLRFPTFTICFVWNKWDRDGIKLTTLLLLL
ncbi:unnamed protein product [Sphenostylis stenocarpa]|uniref:Uncharacterized protein n=1 Tax=Sphenostylis stenocarpa TaxID=92480 RepID=A0AA86RW09_9FABA|nr:unnamed protein product [Sphenostylis stenocarpa]